MSIQRELVYFCCFIIPKIAFLVHHLVYCLVRRWLEQLSLLLSAELLNYEHAFFVDSIVVSLHFVYTRDLHWHAHFDSLDRRYNVPIELREHDNWLVLQVVRRY